MIQIPERDTRRTALTVFLLVIVVSGLFLWFFGKALFTSRSFVFRDAAHYYYPLFEWSSREWSRGRVPLWNPQENCGVPVAAEATSSVFYPGKLLFVLPLDFASKYKLYIAGHVLLAAAAAYYLARQWQLSRMAAGLCAVSYAFSGNVLFQYCNVVFLVGAAWLPLSLVAAHRMFVARRLRWSLALAAILSLMALGGDPQAAYHAGLLAALYAALLWRAERRDAKRYDTQDACSDIASAQDGLHTRGRAWARNRFALLTAAAVAAGTLSAVQILPSIEWTRHSARAAFQSPRSIYEIPTHLARDSNHASIRDGLLGAPAHGTHHEHIYHFSIAPWRLPEYVWPNFSGRLFPTNRRWTNAIPAEGRVWTPSLYMGLLPFILALWCWRLRGGTAHIRLVSWMSLLAILASFGWYGAGWLIHEFRYSLLGAKADDVLIGQPVGGLYWLLVTGLPGYAYFRYPAKLLVIASLGLSVLAGRGLDRLFKNGPGSLRRILFVLACVSLVATLATFTIGAQWSRWMASETAPVDALFGPIDATGSLSDLRIAFLHTTLLCIAIYCLLSWARHSGRIKIAFLLVTVTAFDLAIANGWMIPTAPIRHWQDSSHFASKIQEGEAGDRDAEPFRVYRGTAQSWFPSTWAKSSSTDRQRQGLAWDVDTVYPKHHLRTGLPLVESYGTLSSHDYQTLLNVARRRGPKRPDGVSEPHAALMNALAMKYIISPRGFQYPGTRQIHSQDEQDAPPNAALWLNEDCSSRAWIVHEVETLPPLHQPNPATIASRTRKVLFPDGRPRDLRKTCVVEAAMPDANVNVAMTNQGLQQESCVIAVDEPHRVEVVADLEHPGVLVLSDLYYPGWTAEVTNESDGRQTRVPILRTNRVMRGVCLQPGKQRIVFSYRPTTVRWGAIVSLAGWIAVAIVAAFWIGKRARRKGTPTSRLNST